MCDAFTKLDLEQVLRDVMPRADAENDDRGITENMDAVSNATVDGFSLVINTLDDAREALDDDAPDGKTVLEALDKVIKAIGQIEDFRATLDEKLDALATSQNKLIEAEEERKREDGIDPEALVEELAFRGYEIVRVPPRMLATVVPMPKKRGRPRKIPLSA